MNFSKLKLNKLTESTAQAYFDAEGRNSKASGMTGSATKSLAKQQSRADRTSNIRTLQSQGNSQRTGQVTKGTPIAGTPTPRSGGYDRKFTEEHFRELRQEQELLKRLREHKSDWRSELNESAAPEPVDKEMHPYVDVMPHADHNLRTLKKQMAGGAMEKVGKDIKQEGYAPGDVDERLGAVASIPKKDQEDAKARLLAKAKAKREKMKKEEIELEELDEAKKKCKSGYTYDKKKKKCVKKKKKSSSSKKSSPTYVYIGRPRGFYGGGSHHHHHDDDGDNGEPNGNDGGGDVGGGDAGGGGE